ncbi:MAG: hypothetical protein J6Y26_00555 [Lachnospiraceae bacterium]|nr:hypothetical protein [Lachnospiraceae bacterium]
MSIKSIERRLCSSFYDMAWLNLSAGIENLPDAVAGEDGFGELTEAFRKQFLASGQSLTEAIASDAADAVSEGTESLLGLREAIAQTAEELTLCRAEGRLLRNVLLRSEAAGMASGAVNVEDEVRELLGKLFSSEDPMITNLRIRSMVAAFPARMTRSRFYDRIAGYLSLYNGQEDGDGLDAFLYRLRGAAAVRSGSSDGGNDAAGAVSERAASVAFIDALLQPARDAVSASAADGTAEDAGKTPEKVSSIADSLGEVNAKIDAAIGELESITRCINALAAIGLLTGMEQNPEADSSVVSDVRPAVSAQLRKAAGDSVDEEEYGRVTERAHAAMEQYFEPLSVLMETETGRLQAEIDKMDDASAEAYIPVMKAARLMSTSAFASLEHTPAAAVTPERVEDCRDALIRELDGRFEGQPKPMVREIMAAVLAELPVWFENRTEVMEYMLQSLRGCRTDGEKRFAVRLLRAAL